MTRNKLLALFGSICLVLVLAAVPFMSACVPAPAEEAPIELRFASFLPLGCFYTQQAVLPWEREVEAATDGRVVITHYPSETLCKGAEVWDAVTSGLADVGWAVFGYWKGRFPVNNVLGLPLLPIPNSKAAAGIQWQLYERFPEFANELAEVKVLGFWCCGPRFTFTTEEAGKIETLADLEGKRFRALASPLADFLSAAKTIAVPVPVGEIYTSLDKGIIEGLTMDTAGLDAYTLFDIVKYVNTYPLAYPPMAIVMNWDKWNSLSADIQEAIMSVSGLKGSENLGKRGYDDQSGAFADEIEASGIVTYTLAPEQAQEWRTLAEEVWDAWIEDMETQGVDGQEILDYLVMLAKTYE